MATIRTHSIFESAVPEPDEVVQRIKRERTLKVAGVIAGIVAVLAVILAALQLQLKDTPAPGESPPTQPAAPR